jgi:tripartite-type tricarboxylate transporter receptor subunit TctC
VPAGSGAAAATFPERPVRIVVGFAPGGSIDTLARILAPRLAEKWGQAVVVENRTGADATIAAEFVARSTPDGHTILWTSTSHTIAPSHFRLTYDPVRSFAPVALLTSAPDILVTNPSALPVNSVKELIALARAKPGQLNFGSGGPATASALMMAVFMSGTGIDMRNINYKGNGPALIALLAGEVHMGFVAPADVMEHITSGKVRAIAVSSKNRIPLVPNVPTVAEAAGLRDYDEGVWIGALAAAATPLDVVARLNGDITAILKSPDLEQIIAQRSWMRIASTPDEFARFLRHDLAKWALVLKAVKLN